jgi:hypothetical protein
MTCSNGHPPVLDLADTAITNLLTALEIHREILAIAMFTHGEGPSWVHKFFVVEGMLDAIQPLREDPTWVQAIVEMADEDGVLFPDVWVAGAAALFVPTFDLPGIRKWVRGSRNTAAGWSRHNVQEVWTTTADGDQSREDPR